MKLKDLYGFFIEQGIRKDPRGPEQIRQLLDEEKKKYEKLSAEDKEHFDTEKLTNPYADSRILNGTGDEEIRTIIAGIDMETSEVLLANALRSAGRKIDLILTHHPEGKAYATFYQVMDMQADIMNRFGVPINISESMTGSRMKEVGRKVLPQNHNRAVDAARLLQFPFMSAHTVADNQVASYLQNLFDERQPKRVGDIVKMLEEIPEYAEAKRGGAGPEIVSGGRDSRAGKIFVDMTGGTEGPKEALEKLADSGVGTIVGMHMSEDHLKNAEKNHIRVVLAGHISSDNLGVNLLLDETENRFGPLEIVECSGFRRFRHSAVHPQ